MHNALNDWLLQRQLCLCHRQILRIVGDETWAIDQLTSLAPKLQNVLWVGQGPSSYPQIQNKQYRQYLGKEYDHLVYNAYSGVRANALMALSGVIQRGGLMILITPSDEQWLNYADPEITEKTSAYFQQDCLPSHFIRWLIDNLRHDENLIHYDERSIQGRFLEYSSPLSETPINTPTEKPSQNIEPYKTVGQKEAVTKILALATSKKKCPLVITADRGRGKSTSLGIAAAQLMRSHHLKIGITSTHLKGCENAFSIAKILMDKEAEDQQKPIHEQANFEFFSFDHLLSSKADIDLLFVDEAATIPVNVLKKLHQQYKKIVFSTTVHGYEGTGRGFEIRFKSYLNSQAEHWQQIHLAEPIRWAKNDPIEDFWFKALLHVKPTLANQLTTQLEDGVHVLKPKTLLRSANILFEAFNLLINAHYQTSPDDLQRILDCSEYWLVLKIRDGYVLGAALLVEEPAYLKELANDIVLGKRRIKGFMTPQTLGFQNNSIDVFDYSYLRIIRIAVNENVRKQGIGSGLIEASKDFAKDQAFHFLSTSFGLTPELLGFWQKQLFQLVNVGQHKDQATGEYSGLLLFNLSKDNFDYLLALQNDAEKRFKFQLARTYLTLDVSTVTQIIKQFPANKISKALQEKVYYFCQGQKPLTTCEYELAQVGYEAIKTTTLTSHQQALIILYLLQNQHEKNICQTLSLTGKKELHKDIKAIFQQLG